MTAGKILDQATARAVRMALVQTPFRNLYEFLGLGRDASIGSLYAAADARYKEVRTKGCTDPESDVVQKLAGQAMAVFAGVDAKERYDNTLDQEVMAEFDGHLEVIGRDAYLEVAEIVEVVRRAEERGVSESVARGYILDYAAVRRWGLESCSSPPELVSQRMELCPNCSGKIPRRDAFCGFCGCSREVRRLLDEGARLLEAEQEQNAAACFKKAQRLNEDSSALSCGLERFGGLPSRLNLVKLLKKDGQLDGCVRGFGRSYGGFWLFGDIETRAGYCREHRSGVERVFCRGEA